MINIYAIFDVECKNYGNLICLENDVILKRQLVHLLNSPQNPYKGIEKCFIVYQLGVYDSKNGIINFDKKELFYLSTLIGQNIDIGGSSD